MREFLAQHGEVRKVIVKGIMKIKTFKMKNFRGYLDEAVINFNNFTAFVGKNDVGKSTILDALDLFFNEGKNVVKYEKSDICKRCEEGDEVELTVVFDGSDLPPKVVIDASYETTLEDEHLLNGDGDLEITKRISPGGKIKTYVHALHPVSEDLGKNHESLLYYKNNDLKTLLDKYPQALQPLDANGGAESTRIKNTNAKMRRLLWNCSDIHFENKMLLIDATKQDAKAIWEKLRQFLPLYSLFESDRNNVDGDEEIQDPLKIATKEVLKDESLQESLQDIYLKVSQRLRTVASGTVEKLKELDDQAANSLHPVIPDLPDLKWADVFKNVSIAGDQDIPMNKRGSGVRRLILFSFFRAEVERRDEDNNSVGTIYAIEEPETSQHTHNQILLAKALKKLSQKDNTQVIITTHSAAVVKELQFDDIRLVRDTNSEKQIRKVDPEVIHGSWNEINYLAFEECNEEYHNELFGRLQQLINRKSIAKMDDWLSEQTDYDFDTTDDSHQNFYGDKNNPHKDYTMTAYIRNYIDHPTVDNSHRLKPEYNEIEESIKFMRYLIQREEAKGTHSNEINEASKATIGN